MASRLSLDASSGQTVMLVALRATPDDYRSTPWSYGGGHSVDMCCACSYALHMGAMIQIRNVPDALHRRLKSRAALAGMSLSDYLLSEIRQVAERPTLDELRARLRDRTETTPSEKPARAVRAERDRA
jgi:antitoxin FitA